MAVGGGSMCPPLLYMVRNEFVLYNGQAYV